MKMAIDGISRTPILLASPGVSSNWNLARRSEAISHLSPKMRPLIKSSAFPVPKGVCNTEVDLRTSVPDRPPSSRRGKTRDRCGILPQSRNLVREVRFPATRRLWASDSYLDSHHGVEPLTNPLAFVVFASYHVLLYIPIR